MTTIRPEFVEFIPQKLTPDVLYISERYHTASHLCACGCGEKVVTPLSSADWQLTLDRGTVSLYPSIGNWNYACRSHYWIQRSEVIWSGRMSAARIAQAQRRDRLDKSRLIKQRNLAKQGFASPSSEESQARDDKLPAFWTRLSTAVARLLHLQ